MIDIFDIMGPIMVGPSSSHTAGAVRIGRMARTLLGDEPVKAALHLHGSFATTGVGHGTDKALVAGLLGMAPDDLDIPISFDIAAERGLKFTFDEEDVSFTGDYHTLIIQNMDNRGSLADVSTALSLAGVNVASMNMSRSSKGSNVMMILETDDPIPDFIVQLIERQPGILQVIHYKKE